MGWLSDKSSCNTSAAPGNIVPGQIEFSTSAGRPARRQISLIRGACIHIWPAPAALSCIILLSVLLYFPQASASYPTVELLGYTFSFGGKDYNPTRDESTWHYTVTGPMVSGPRYKDLSHWILALCGPHQVVEASGRRWERRTKPDPHHGLTGIKWDDEVSKTGSRSFHFVIKGDWAVDMTVAIGAKAGPEVASGILPGPSCQPDTCRIDYDITTRSDWRFLKPGIYAAPVLELRLTGESAVRLEFKDFHDAEYVADWNASPPIRFEYSLGATIDDAEAFGWHSAPAFNDVEVVIPIQAVLAGAQVNVWMRAFVTEANRSSEYAGGGRVAVVPLCD